MLATDLADYLVRKEVPFRQTHSTVGKLDNTAAKLVQYAINENKGFEKLSLDEYRSFSPLFAKEVYIITAEVSIAA